MTRVAPRLNLLYATRIACLSGALALAGCAHVAYTPSPSAAPAPAQGPRYESVNGLDAASIARLRAAPAPAQPRINDGATREGDAHLLRARGFVHIGTGYFPMFDPVATRAAAIAQGVQVHADQILIYAPNATRDSSEQVESIADYYVRLHLPFGATFRDLTPAEHQALGVDGVQIGEVVGDTPAAEANLRIGDFVIKFNHTPVRDKATFQTLLQSHMGHRVTLTIRRDGATFKRLVRLGKLAPEPAH